MLFSSIPFLYWFLFAFFAVYFLVPKSCKNFVILVFSLYFYGCGEPIYLVLMSTSILVGYASGRLLGKFGENRTAKKAILIGSVVILAGFLAYFKYADFFIANFNALTGLSVPLLRVSLPIGISFYTFQILSYTVDVYRGEAEVQKNFINFAAYVTMFPQLIAGPIVRYTDVAKELNHRTHSLDKAYEGVRRFIVGLSKKIIFANALAELVDIFKASGEKSVLFYWMYAICYAMFVYFDFSGYSDMAIGIGKIMGFHFPENFNYPFISKSITEFWRRWHMTLGGWFRDYIYIPLGGNRVSKARQIFNIAVVWALTGLWHGAAWNFVLWGVLFAVLLVFEKLIFGKVLKKMPAVFSHALIMLVIVISFVIFDSTELSDIGLRLGGMFGLTGAPLVSGEAVYYLRSFGFMMILSIIGCTPLMKKIHTKIGESTVGARVLSVAEPIGMVALLLICTAFLVDGSFNPFLYFRF